MKVSDTIKNHSCCMPSILNAKADIFVPKSQLTKFSNVDIELCISNEISSLPCDIYLHLKQVARSASSLNPLANSFDSKTISSLNPRASSFMPKYYAYNMDVNLTTVSDFNFYSRFVMFCNFLCALLYLSFYRYLKNIKFQT